MATTGMATTGKATDLLAGAVWACAATPPGVVPEPADLVPDTRTWLPASVPGTVAGALRAASAGAGAAGEDDSPADDALADDGALDLDAGDWWFRCRFDRGAEPGPWRLHLGGLATLADVWLNDRHVLHSENMFVAHDLVVDVDQLLDDGNELLIRCAALAPLLAGRRPRPRWKAGLVEHQGLRWFRSTLLGRLPGWGAVPVPVGPWRPVRLERAPPLAVVSRRLVASCRGSDGVVELSLRLRGDGGPPSDGLIRVGTDEGRATVTADGDEVVVEGVVRVVAAERWWPHTHGSQPLYPASVAVGPHRIDLGHVGFRTVEADRSGDGFRLLVNGVPVFCRGACWVPPDVVTLAAGPDVVRSRLEQVRAAGMNMLRVSGTFVYEDAHFWDLCDRTGVMVWQDCMFATLDPPDDPAFVAGVEEELEQVLGGLQGRPSLAVVCGATEVEQQPAMLGLGRDRWSLPLFDKTIPTLAARVVPDVPYVTSSPTGGPLPFHADAGVAHYQGVGAYRRPLDDARRAGVRFASECLAFAVPPERGGTAAAGAGRGVPRDAHAAWDFGDVTDHYVRLLFGVDPDGLRADDPERVLDLSRAAVSHVMGEVMTEWRRPRSSCSGGLVFTWQDLEAGGGWGLLDVDGRPKAPWFALRRVLQPIALLVTDEGGNGLRLHVVNDTATDFAGRVLVERYTDGERVVEQAGDEVVVPARSGIEVSAEGLFDGFRDLTYAYRFGPPPHDVVVTTLVGADGRVMGDHVHLPLGLDRPLEPDVGLRARARPGGPGVPGGPGGPGGDGAWVLTVTSRRFAQFVAVDVPGFAPSDSWFHLAPGASRTVALRPHGEPDDRAPVGTVRALNATATAAVEVEAEGGAEGGT